MRWVMLLWRHGVGVVVLRRCWAEAGNSLNYFAGRVPGDLVDLVDLVTYFG